MASMTIADIRSYVYGFLDIDSNDLPSTVLDRLIEQAWNHIINTERRWSFYEQNATFNSQATVQDYPLDTLASVEPWADITAVSDPTWGPLRPLSHVSARRKFKRTITSNRPSAFSFESDRLWLWPKPNAVLTYTVDGYRKPKDWLTQGGPPDAPNEFHPLVAQYALSLAYGQQDDPAGADQTMQRFEAAFAQIRQRYIDDTTAGPMILNGGEGTTEFMPARLLDRADFFG